MTRRRSLGLGHRIGRLAMPLLPLVFLSATTCTGVRPGEGDDPGNADGGTPPAERCAAGVDSDFDGLNNDQECTLGTDPFKADSDGDGVADGLELKYPKACVAKNMNAQRRPPPACKEDKDCMAGEVCQGLSPTKKDTDGDGVPDGQEDLDRDGKIDIAKGETDPRVFDTDGDGASDGMGGLDICRPDGLAKVNITPVPMGPIQLGYDPIWGKTTAVTGTMGRGGLVLDDPTTGAAGAVFSNLATGDVRVEAMKAETAVSTAIGAGVTAVLTGRALITHEMNAAVTSTYRIARNNTNASALRDLIVNAMTGAAAPGGGSAGASSEFLMDITTVRRNLGAQQRTDIVVTIAPRTLYEDPTKATQIRTNDLVNTTGVSEAGKTVGNACQVFKADKASLADFLWTVDTSGSMSDDQERLGRTATKFFARLNGAGVDFRVGVMQAGYMAPNLDAPGFTFIDGKDPNGALTLCRQVTYGQCPMGGAESLAPYTMGGGMEEPVASAIVSHSLFKKRGMMGEMNINRKFRDGAKVVAFFVTDEPGSNDFSRYFATAKDPDTNAAFGAAYNATTLDNIVAYFKRNNILTFGLVPVSTTACKPTAAVADLPKCVVEGNGGATIKIETATDAEVDAAMTKIVDAVAGATSQFKLDRSPITSTIKVKVRGKEVPRSRSDGFDYDAASKSVIFFGQTFRPNKDDQVVISYRVWEGSLG